MSHPEVSLDIQEISLDLPKTDSNTKEISIDKMNDDLADTNFGGGIELLMNDKMKSGQSSGGGGGDSNASSGQQSSIQKELDDLNELNEVVEPPSSISDYKEKDSFKHKPAVEIAKATSNLNDNSESWDGFKDINTVNIDSINDKTTKMSEQELLREKFEMLRKLDSLESKGANLSKKYGMESDLDEMRGEYEFLINEKEKSNSVKFQGKVLTTMITGLEFLNSKFDPFDIKLDGWSEQINENVDDFDEIFAELHEKYKSKAKMAPEIKLLFQLASSGIMIHMTNTMFKSALPGMDDIMRQNPDLMSQFTKAAMNSMEQNQPGLGGFMNEFSPPGGNGGGDMRPPPPTASKPPGGRGEPPAMRSEMKGPGVGNIDSLLASARNKKIRVDNDSTISLEEVNSLSSDKKGRSKRKSDKSTISLAI